MKMTVTVNFGLTKGLQASRERIIILPILFNRGLVMADAAGAKAKDTEETGMQLALRSLDGMIATSQRLVKLCDDFIAGQPEREKVYLDFLRTVEPKPEVVALRPEAEKEMENIFRKKLKEIRGELVK